MSIILDALRRRSADRGGDEGAPHGGRAVPATLGYSPPPRGVSLRSLLLYGVAAVLIGFIGVAGMVAVLSPSVSPQPATARIAVPSPPGPAPPTPAARSAAAPQQETKPDANQGLPGSGTAGRISASSTDIPPRVVSPSGASAAALPSTSSNAVLSPPVTLLPTPPSSSPGVTERAKAGSTTSMTRSPTARPTTRPIETRAAIAPGSAPQSPVPVRSAVPPPAPEPASPSTPTEDHFELALYCQRIGDFDSALVHYRALLEQQDASAEVHNNLGLLYDEHGQRADAVTQFQRAIAIDPKYVKAHNNLGVALMRGNSLPAAAAEFRVALAADPRNVESLVNLALLQKAAGRVEDARDLLRRALTIDPRNAGSHYNLAVVADEGGDAATAIEHYRAFLRFGTVTHADLVGRVRARLTTLGG